MVGAAPPRGKLSPENFGRTELLTNSRGRNGKPHLPVFDPRPGDHIFSSLPSASQWGRGGRPGTNRRGVQGRGGCKWGRSFVLSSHTITSLHTPPPTPHKRRPPQPRGGAQGVCNPSPTPWGPSFLTAPPSPSGRPLGLPMGQTGW